jgi:predicted GIY-YIG superfamily endonuclease
VKCFTLGGIGDFDIHLVGFVLYHVFIYLIQFFTIKHNIVLKSIMENKVVEEKWYCYILRNRNPHYAHLTYNGSTNNPVRRLRQHNQEISGGAVYTKKAPGDWEIYFLMTGFPDHKNALSCEWRIKHTEGKPRTKRPAHHSGVKGRVFAMNEILQLERWTQQCQHNNREQQFTIYLADDALSYIDLGGLPPNVVYGGSVESLLCSL